MATHHLLLAIDGTGSEGWRASNGQNSHVYRFYNDFNGLKQYMDGPSTVGLEMIDIVREGTRWIVDMIGFLTRRYNTSPENIKINLVGHSRGGSAVIAVANALNSLTRTYTYMDGLSAAVRNIDVVKDLPSKWYVNFLGLYDAADPHPIITHDLRVPNVISGAQAFRIDNNLTRPSFHYLPVQGKVKDLGYYDTSHGGVGGDPGFFSDIKPGEDLYCNIRRFVDAEQVATSPSNRSDSPVFQSEISYQAASVPSMVFDNTRAFLLSSPVAQLLYAYKYLNLSSGQVILKNIYNNWVKSAKVDQDIRSKAIDASVPIAGTSPHVPWHNKDQKRGMQLQRLLIKAGLVIPSQ